MKINKCKVCGKETTNAHYCSMECRDVSRKKSTYEIRICPICNTKFECRKKESKKYCSIKCSARDSDLNAIKTKTDFPLKGEIAARILDLCGLVVNKNTIPGDESAADASGIRLGTPWITQRGLGKEDMEKLMITR